MTTSEIKLKDGISQYLQAGRDFIDEKAIEKALGKAAPGTAVIRRILKKSLASCETLEPEETAALLAVEAPELLEEMFDAAARLKKKIYNNRVVTFAPLYCSNLCGNNCLYCGFRKDNAQAIRRMLSVEEIKKETEVLCGAIGHKRLVIVFGEHAATGADYIAEAIRAIYSVRVNTRKGVGQIRRVNVNAAPMSVLDLKKLKEAGIGTYQVFQETYHRGRYAAYHPGGTPKSDFRWRLYSMHRAFEAGIDDVALGALFGLGDWKFEVMGLLAHAKELEKTFGIGPHTISFPRIEDAPGAGLTRSIPEKVSDRDFKKLVAVLRLSIPYAGMLVTARETPDVIREVISMCTQRDAASRIGIGAYAGGNNGQESERQQFMLGDTRSLDEVIGELACLGHITSFCTSGYRCGRTGDHIMKMLKSGREGRFCKLNAVLTFREWLDDFASPDTRVKGEELILMEIQEILVSDAYSEEIRGRLRDYYDRIKNGERDLCF
ncbi:MAG: [FeFe] hydrogenase H-cluster radical SAM maturase HydG [Lentisphaerae bacterium GWF2_52_8]|nr:MAG: [FeFe] hydrogenase H-cluster radical SAM maturase HydG [Lentisphaerae bacterium GWF2_52_8]